MFQKLFFISTFLAGYTIAHTADSKLEHGRQIFYKEIGCTPLNDCGSSYDCPDFSTTIRQDKCYYNGRKYDIGAHIDDKDGPSRFCQAACFCQWPFEIKFAQLICAAVDCPYEGPLRPGQHCISQYDGNTCCASRSVCDEELKRLEQCHLDGKTFYEGQRMYPEEDCHICKCAKGFNNCTLSGNPHCEEVSCNILGFRAEAIYNGCAPVFYKNVCCPIEFRCPSSSDVVISKGKPHGGVCTFGNLQIGIGGEINTDNEDTVCRCAVPPIIECLKSPPHHQEIPLLVEPRHE